MSAPPTASARRERKCKGVRVCVSECEKENKRKREKERKGKGDKERKRQGEKERRREKGIIQLDFL